jgi:chromosome segregation ATPase
MKRIELKELIREILLTEFQRDKEIETKINEFGELNDEIDRVKNQLEGLKKRYSQLEGELRPILEHLQQFNQKSVQTERYLVSIKRMGYEKTNYRYKEVFEESLEKVNKNTKRLLENLLESTKSLSKVVSSIGVQPLNENLWNKIIGKIKRIFQRIIPQMKSTQSEMDTLQKVSKMMMK